MLRGAVFSFVIILIGLPGSGKSSVGKQLARRLAVPFLDSDHCLEQRLGCSIRDFFARTGEQAFRELEERMLDELSASRRGILSTGGGSVLRAVNRQRLHERGLVVYLHASPEEVYRRVRHDTTRPLLQVPDPLGRLRELYAERDPLYRETAHFTVETGRNSMPTLVNMVLMQLELAGLTQEPAAPAAG